MATSNISRYRAYVLEEGDLTLPTTFDKTVKHVDVLCASQSEACGDMAGKGKVGMNRKSCICGAADELEKRGSTLLELRLADGMNRMLLTLGNSPGGIASQEGAGRLDKTRHDWAVLLYP